MATAPTPAPAGRHVVPCTDRLGSSDAHNLTLWERVASQADKSLKMRYYNGSADVPKHVVRSMSCRVAAHASDP